MKYMLWLILTFNLTAALAQTEMRLRDVSFRYPSEFITQYKQNSGLDYDLFYENGKLFTDSSAVESARKIYYQYYENPATGNERAEAILKRLNDIMEEDYKADTIVLNSSKNFSIAKYTIIGKELYEVKSLGQNGWLNVQYFVDKPEKSDMQDVLTIANSIEHKQPYHSKYHDYLKESGESSKWFIIFFIISLLIYFGRKFVKKFEQEKVNQNKETKLADKPWPVFPDNDDFLDRECYIFEEETFDDFRDRYTGFGKEIYDLLQQKHPDILNHLKFYKITGATGKCVGQPNLEGSTAIYDGKVNFVITLDYYSTIVVGNYEATREFGDRNDAAVEDAVEFVAELIKK
ncbi:MAG: hypothetical protein ACO1N9_10660 [Flavobacterium sp.]